MTAKKKSKKTAQRTTQEIPKDTGNKADVAAFAAQILQAQILGLSQYQMLSAFRHEIQGCLVALAEFIEANQHQKDGDSQSPAERLERQLNQLGRSNLKPEPLGPIGHSRLDSLARSALSWADRMLGNEPTSEEIVFVEQVFQPNEFLSESRIAERLKFYRWPKLKARPSVRSLIAAVEEWFTEWMTETEKSPPGRVENALREPNKSANDLRILNDAKAILDRTNAEYSELNAPYRRESQALAKLILKIKQEPVVSIPRREIKEMDFDLITFMFGGKEPEDLVALRRKSGDKALAKRLYCPWGIFRYLRLFGENLQASDLNKKLKVERRELPPFARPDLVHSDLYGMHLLEEQIGYRKDE